MTQKNDLETAATDDAIPKIEASTIPPPTAAPDPYIGKTVLVVGTGNSGAEICVDLVESGAARVLLSVRTPPTVLLRDTNGMPGQALSSPPCSVPTIAT